MSFTDLNLQSSYETDENDIINDFYVVEKQVPVKQGLRRKQLFGCRLPKCRKLKNKFQ